MRQSNSTSLASAWRVVSSIATGISLGLFLALAAGPTEAATPRPLALPIPGPVLIDFADPGPVLIPVGSTVTVSLACQAHPHILEWEPVPPFRPLPASIGYRCWDYAGNWANPCVGDTVVDQCGTWSFVGACRYAFIVDGQPYTSYAETSALVVGCSIFADGFEVGDTTNWTSTVP